MAALGAQAVLSGGKLTVTNVAGTVDLVGPIRLADATSYSKTAYAAGTASVKRYNLAAVSLAANTTYSLSVEIPGRVDFASGGGQEANELFAIRTYTVSSGTSAPSSSDLRDLFIDAINNDEYAAVTAASGGAGLLDLTLDDVAFGDFTVTAPTGATEAVTTPYVAPSGTPAIVEEFVAPTLVDATAEYTTYLIAFDNRRRHSAVNGGKVMYPEFVYVFANELGANFAAFETALDAMLGGSHTPVADYLGV